MGLVLLIIVMGLFITSSLSAMVSDYYIHHHKHLRQACILTHVGFWTFVIDFILIYFSLSYTLFFK